MDPFQKILDAAAFRLETTFSPVFEFVSERMAQLSTLQWLMIVGGVLAFVLYVAVRAPRRYAGGPKAWDISFAVGAVMLTIVAFGGAWAWQEAREQGLIAALNTGLG
jgi:hypothetical protein